MLNWKNIHQTRAKQFAAWEINCGVSYILCAKKAKGQGMENSPSVSLGTRESFPVLQQPLVLPQPGEAPPPAGPAAIIPAF